MARNMGKISPTVKMTIPGSTRDRYCSWVRLRLRISDTSQEKGGFSARKKPPVEAVGYLLLSRRASAALRASSMVILPCRYSAMSLAFSSWKPPQTSWLLPRLTS